jgi:hypothetical protein
MNQQYRISEHEILYYDNSKVQLFYYYMPTTKHNTWQHQRVKLPNSNILLSGQIIFRMLKKANAFRMILQY